MSDGLSGSALIILPAVRVIFSSLPISPFFIFSEETDQIEENGILYHGLVEQLHDRLLHFEKLQLPQKVHFLLCFLVARVNVGGPGHLVVDDNAQISVGLHHLHRLALDGNRLSLSVCWSYLEVYH